MRVCSRGGEWGRRVEENEEGERGERVSERMEGVSERRRGELCVNEKEGGG